MKQICKYSASHDIREVQPHLTIDLGEAIRSGKIPSTGTEPVYNDIQNPSDVVGRVTDVFQSVDIERAALAQGKADKAAQLAAESSQTIVNPPTEVA